MPRKKPNDEPSQTTTRRLEGNEAEARLVRQMREALAAYERESETVTTEADVLSRSYVEWIADQWHQHRDNAAERGRLVEQLADALTADDVRTLRRVADALGDVTTAHILRLRASGLKPPRIAEQLGVTDTYVRRVLAQHPTDDTQ